MMSKETVTIDSHLFNRVVDFVEQLAETTNLTIDTSVWAKFEAVELYKWLVRYRVQEKDAPQGEMMV